MSRSVGMVLVAVLVVLAGCTGALSGGNNKSVETFTPASDPTAKPTPTPVPQLAPGLTAEGIENASVLIAAHTSFLQNRSFTRTMSRTELASNNSVVTRRKSILYGSVGEGAHAILKVADGLVSPLVRGEAWSNGERLFLKRTYADGKVIYSQISLRGRFGISGSDFAILRLFGIANTSVVKRFTKNGMRLYRVRGMLVEQTPSGNVTASLQLLVDSRGVIHEYRAVYRPASGINRPTEIHELHFSNIGATEVLKPSWVDEAINQTTPIPEGTPTPTMPATRWSSTTSA